MPHEVLNLPDPGGWVSLALAVGCWQDAEDRGAELVQSLKSGAMPVFVVGA